MRKVLIFLIFSISLAAMEPEQSYPEMTCRMKTSLLDAFRTGDLVAKSDRILEFCDYQDTKTIFKVPMTAAANYFKEIFKTTPDPEVLDPEKKRAFNHQHFFECICLNRFHLLTGQDHQKLLEHIVAWELQGTKGKREAKASKPILVEALEKNNALVVNWIIRHLRVLRGPELSRPIELILKTEIVESEIEEEKSIEEILVGLRTQKQQYLMRKKK